MDDVNTVFCKFNFWRRLTNKRYVSNMNYTKYADSRNYRIITVIVVSSGDLSTSIYSANLTIHNTVVWNTAVLLKRYVRASLVFNSGRSNWSALASARLNSGLNSAELFERDIYRSRAAEGTRRWLCGRIYRTIRYTQIVSDKPYISAVSGQWSAAATAARPPLPDRIDNDFGWRNKDC